ncbi:tetratricopeptide repeat protein [Lutibacter holmesii]|uniref:Tetratricopeptide repeat protein n=1 Tax=Lutibacter holmesii TaxID=1137985 RepID=A0ABW3WLZ5_9FLAO
MIQLFQKLNDYIYKITGKNRSKKNSYKNPVFIILASLTLVTILFAYSNHFLNSFHFDDNHTIENNSAIQELNIINFFKDATTFSSLPTNQSYRPLTTLENTIDYKLGNGLNPKVFHIHIFLTYLIVCALLLIFTKKLLDKINFSKVNQFWALLVTAFFGLLCVNTETVNYIIQRAEIVSALFVLAGLIAYLSNGFWRKKLAYLIFPFIGFFSKEMAFVFAPLLLLYFLIFEENVDLLHFYRKNEFKKCIKSFIKILPAFILTVIYYIFYSYMMPSTFSPGGNSQFNYLITQPMVMVHYIVTYFIPYNLSADTDWVAYKSLFDYRAISGIILITLLFYIALKTSKKKETKLFSFGILWFFISLLPTSSFIPFAEVLNDHRTFIPYIGLTIAFVFGTNYLAQKYLSKNIERKTIQSVIILAITLFLGLHTYGIRERNKVWKSELSLWKDVTIKSPNNGRGLMNYGLALMGKGDYNGAITYFNKGLELNPNYASLYINLGIATKAIGNNIAAENYYKKAIQLTPTSHKTLFFYGKFLIDEGRLEEGEEFLLKSLNISPTYTKANFLLLELYHKKNDWEKLNKLAEKILKKLPNNDKALKYLDISINKESILMILEEETKNNPSPEKYLNLSFKYFQNNNFRGTISAANSALQLKSNYPDAYNNIGIAHYMLKEYDLAIKAYNNSISLKPDYKLAQNNLANATKAKKNMDSLLNPSAKNRTSNYFLNLSLTFYNDRNYLACINAAKKSIQINPSADAYNNICAAYNQLKEFENAIEAGNKAIKLEPEHRLANGNLKYALNNIKTLNE